VTGADFNYHGSITLDPKHCEMAGIYPMEFIDVWNKNWAGATIRSPRSAKLILIFDESH
jgi:aspartate 1-decarboxylase